MRRNKPKVRQVELAQELGVSKAYISMVLSGKKKASQRIAEELVKRGINLDVVNSQSSFRILSHARLPVPTLPPA